MINLSLTEALIIAGIIQAVVLSISGFKTFRENSANRIFHLLILIGTVMLAARLLAFQVSGSLAYRYIILADNAIFLIGPLTFLYVKSIYGSASIRTNRWHFIPSILHLLFFGWTCLQSWPALMEHYQEGFLLKIFVAIESLGLISLIIYWVASFIMVRKSGNPPGSEDKRLPVYFLGALFILMISWVIGYTDSYFIDFGVPTLSYELIWIFIPAWIHFVGYYKLTSNIITNTKKASVKRKRVKLEELRGIKSRLNEIAEDPEFFFDPELKLDQLASAVNSTPNDLSWVLNEVYHTSFYEFVNKVRIDSFLKKIEENEHHHKTLLALSMEVGFKSKSTFNSAFKNTMKLTPSQYIDQLHHGELQVVN